MIRTAFPPLLLALAVLVAGCTVDNEHRFPSLAVRPVERRSEAVATPPAAPVAPVDAALAERLEAIVREAQAGHAGFQKAAAAAEAANARGARAAEGSDAWADRQTALSALVAARGPLLDVEAALDGLRREEAGQPPAGLQAIEATARTVQALDDEQTATLARLSR